MTDRFTSKALSMIRWLLSHQWKEEARSVMRYQNLAGGIVFGVLLLVLGLNMLATGIFLNAIILKLRPGVDPASLINGFLLYYFIFDLFMRFFLQGIPSQRIEPYRLLPVKKSTLVNYLLSLSLLSVFNLLPMLIVIPFAVEAIAIPHSVTHALVWIATIMFLLGCNSLLSVYFKKQIINNPKVVVSSAIAVTGFVAADHYGIFSLRHVSTLIFGSVLQYPTLLVVPLAMFALLYLVNYYFLREHSYRDDLQFAERRGGTADDRFDFLQDFGSIGSFMALELKLLFRNKRPRSTIYFSLSMLLTGAILYGTNSYDSVSYPIPNEKNIQASDQQKAVPSPSLKRVTFHVTTPRVPAGAFVYVAGSIPELGNWTPSKIHLTRQPDSSWACTIHIPPDTAVQFKFTLGSWRTQALTAEGLMPENSVLRVTRDTTIDVHVAQWKTPNMDFVQDLVLVYFGLFMTGMLMFSYGQFLLSWEGSYFDLLISRRIDFGKYFRAKYILFLLAGTLFYIFSLPFGYFGSRVIVTNTAVFLYNIGINPFTFFYMATFSRRRLDLNASIFTNQGKGASQYLTILPAFILPLFVYVPVGLWISPEAGLIVLAGAGVLGILFHRQLLMLILKRIKRQKYNIAAGCRQN